MKKLNIAIDGPAGAGKSTVAQIVAQRLNYIYIDTGAMYRAVAWKALATNSDVNDQNRIAQLAEKIEIQLTYDQKTLQIFADGVNITDSIRSQEVTNIVACVAQNKFVREAMLHQQRRMAVAGGIVMDGRDIGTQVLPNADVKIFLTASIEERASRRWKELVSKGCQVDFDKIKDEIACRDKADCEREIAPLIKAKDAILVDTTKLSIQGAVNHILKICEERIDFV
jgi:cytidylate kinase